MKRPGITARLALCMLALATLIVVAMSVAGRLSFKHDFLGYLNEQALHRMDAAIPQLGKAYAEHGSWDFIRNRQDLWSSVVGSELRQALVVEGSYDALPDEVATDMLGTGRRLTLLDAQRRFVIGFPVVFRQSKQRAIVVDNKVVGWLAIAPFQSAADEAVDRFRGGQMRASLFTGGMAILLSALVAWWVARSFLDPVRAIAQASHRLSSGDYATRVDVKGRDEVAQLAQDFNQLALTLERNERMRRDFMADVSHELRTPLAVLRGELEAMEDGVHELTPDALRMLQAEVGTLTALVGDLHELALADVGALSYRKVELDLVSLVAEEISTFQPRYSEKSLALTLESSATPLLLSADRARMRQLLHNLLENSLRYTAAGGRLLVRVHAQASEAVVDLQDSAPGVAAELLPRLFERFYRVEASRERASGGSGLGLSICRSIVQAHGGSIQARLSPLGGVWMEIRLPRIRSSVGDAA